MNLYFSFNALASALIYALLGLAVFAAAFHVATKSVLPGFRSEIVEKQNLAAAVLIGLLAIAVAIIVAAAVH